MDNIKLPPQEENIDVREIVRKFTAYWHWFAISVLVCLAIAYWVNYTSVPVYEVKTSILIEKNKSMLDERFSSSLINESSYQVGNQISVLRSYALVKRALGRLDFRISYFQKNRFTSTEIYKASPFRVVPDTTSIVPVNVPIYITIESPDQFLVQIKSEGGSLYSFNDQKINGSFVDLNISVKGNIYQPVRYNNLNFTIIPADRSDLKNHVGKSFYFVVIDDLSLINQYKNISINESKNSSLIYVSLLGINVPKSVDFLNTLTTVYLEKCLEKKNKIAENTIKFIDSQLGGVADSLNFSEKSLQDYRKANDVMDLSFQAQQVFTSIENLKNQRAELVIKTKYYDYIYKYLKESNDGKDLVIPSAFGIQDVVVNSQINELINLYSERAELIVNSKRDNPYIAANELRIKNIRQSILKNIETSSKGVKMELQDVDKRIEEISHKGNKLPETQRNLIGIERKFKLNDALFTYLLTKRSEMQIAKASYLPDHEVIDEATPDVYSYISPNKRRNYMMGIIFGLGIPLVFILLRDYFYAKVRQDDDVEKVCEFPILGHIIRSKENKPAIIAENPMSLTSESIRAIRTNFQFLANGRKQNTILITSSIQGEGKSFSSLNIALSFALFKKKTILLNFDLRRPKLQEYLDIEVEVGLSAYLSGNVSLDDVIVKTKFEYLDIITAGVIPPNPMELIGSDYTKNLFNSLKESYDYVVIDTPPVGLVADCLLLLEYSDVNFFIVRQRYTPKKVFAKLMEYLDKRNIKNLNIIINDISLQKGYNHYNGYAYGYGYGYTNEKQKRRV